MSRSSPASPPPGPTSPPLTRTLRLPTAAVLPLLIAIVGCGNSSTHWGYDRIRIGQSPGQYERVLPTADTRRTQLGLCYLGRGALGATDAIVVLLTPDRRVAGKLHARWTQRNYGFKSELRYRLRGEVDPLLADLRTTGPIDVLRMIASDLVNYQGEQLAREAHHWVAAGLVRMIQPWPHVRDVGLDEAKLREALERVPGGGAVRLGLDGAGVYRFEYEQTVDR